MQFEKKKTKSFQLRTYSLNKNNRKKVTFFFVLNMIQESKELSAIVLSYTRKRLCNWNPCCFKMKIYIFFQFIFYFYPICKFGSVFELRTYETSVGSLSSLFLHIKLQLYRGQE